MISQREDADAMCDGGHRTPERTYEAPFHSPPAWRVMHWHWFWSTATTLCILRPPPPSTTHAGTPSTPAVIEALARALVADVLAEAQQSDDNGECRDQR